MKVFLSHSSVDKTFVRRLRRELEQLGFAVWMDDAVLTGGMSLVSSIQKGIIDVDALILILSPESLSSTWVMEEWEGAHAHWLQTGRPTVVPIVCKSVTLPPFLGAKLCIDFTVSHALGLSKLAVALTNTVPIGNSLSVYANHEELLGSVSISGLLCREQQEIVFCGFTHSSTLFAHSDDQIRKWISRSRSFELFIAKAEHRNEVERRQKMAYYKRKFSYHELDNVLHRCERIARSLDSKTSAKFQVRLLDIPRVNLLNLKLIGDRFFCRMIGFGQMGSDSPILEVSRKSRMGSFFDTYLEKLRDSPDFWTPFLGTDSERS